MSYISSSSTENLTGELEIEVNITSTHRVNLNRLFNSSTSRFNVRHTNANDISEELVKERIEYYLNNMEDRVSIVQDHLIDIDTSVVNDVSLDVNEGSTICPGLKLNSNDDSVTKLVAAVVEKLTNAENTPRQEIINNINMLTLNI